MECLVWAALRNLPFRWNVLLWLPGHLNPVIVLLEQLAEAGGQAIAHDSS